MLQTKIFFFEKNWIERSILVYLCLVLAKKATMKKSNPLDKLAIHETRNGCKSFRFAPVQLFINQGFTSPPR